MSFVSSSTPMLNVICGPFVPGLEQAFLKSLDDAQRGDPMTPVAVVALSRNLLRHLEILTATPLPPDRSRLNITFTTLYELAREVNLAAGDATPSTSDPIFMEHLIRSILTAEPDSYPTLRFVDSAHRISRSLYQTLRDLRDSGLDGDAALKALEEKFLGEDDPEKTRDILKLYHTFVRVQRHYGIRDDAEALSFAAERAAASPALQRFKSILVYGFYDLTGTQLDFFLALAKHFPVTLFFPSVADDPDYAFAETFLERHLGSAAQITRLPARPTPLETRNVEVLHVSGTSNEVWAAAKEVMRLTTVEGYACHDIAVAARSLERYRILLPAIFDDHHIPYTLDTQTPLLSHPAAATLIQLLSVHPDHFPRSTVIDLLSSYAFKRSAAARPDLWDFLSRRLGIGRDLATWRKRLQPWTEKDFTTSIRDDDEIITGMRVPREQARLLLDTLNALAAGFDSIPQEGTYPELGAAVRNFIRSFLEIPDDLSQSLEHIFRTVDAYDAFGTHAIRSEYLDLLREKLSLFRFRESHRNQRGVAVMDVMAARGIPCKVLILLGMNEKIFPRFILEDPHLRDAVRSRLTFTLGAKVPQKLEGYHEERLLFRMMLDHATDRTVLIYQRSDEKGQVQVPSIYLRPFRHRARSIPMRIASKLESLEPRMLTPNEAPIRLSLDRADLVPFFRSMGRDTQRYDQLRRTLDRLEEDADGLTPYDGAIGPIPGLIRTLRSEGVSPTNLERLSRCPFKFFGMRLLHLDETDDPEDVYDLSKLETGTLVHRVMEEFYRRLADPDGFPKKPPKTWPALLDRTAREVFLRYEQEGIVVYPLLWKSRQNQFVEKLKEFIEQDLYEIAESGFLPTFFECNVSGRITLGGAAFACHGKIDRIDVRRNGKTVEIRVVDYKTGRPEKTKLTTLIRKGEKLQLPLYLALAREYVSQELRVQTVAKSEAQYVYVFSEDEDKRVQSIEASEIFEHEDKIKQVMTELYGLFDRGEFFIRPDSYAQCKWCPLTEVCRKNHHPSRWRAVDSPQMAAYEQILSSPKSEEKKSHGKTRGSRRAR